MKILMQGDSPLVPTGFGRVMSHLTKRLVSEGHEIELVAVNHPIARNDPKITEEYPFVIEGMLKERTGEHQGFQVLTDMLKFNEYDLVFVLNDQSILMHVARIMQEFETRGKKMPPLIGYMPLDIDFMHGVEFSSHERINHLIAYNKHSMEVLREAYPKVGEVSYMYHGIDMSEFTNITRQMKKQKRKLLQAEKDTFLVINVNRNQWRKDIAVSMLGFMLFCHQNPNIDAKYYIHAAKQDMGGNLDMQMNSAVSVMKRFYPDFEYKNNIMFPSQVGVPFQEVAAMIAASDVYVSTTIGEGWGLGVTEAMAAKTPVIVPKNTSMFEIVGDKEERGYFIRSGETLNDWRIFYQANDMFRPMAYPIDLAEQLKHIYENREEAKQKAEVAYKWVSKNTWENVLNHFIEVINKFK